MYSKALLAAILCFCAAADALGACAPMRVGYPDQNRPPYYLGTGSAPANPPGASVELLREITASADCPMRTLRLPALRLRLALANGQVEGMALEATDEHTGVYALPLDKNGKLDADKAIHNYTIIYVRAADAKAAGAEPEAWFQTHSLGAPQGSPFVAELRGKGLQVDDGAHDYLRNLEKLKRGRIDGFAVSVIELGDLDGIVTARYGSELVRLERPIRTRHVWFAVNKAYYAANKDAVETMWNWVRANAQTRLSVWKKKYEAMPSSLP
jgi:polar amino acid transport system substrate-binding protein